MASWKTNIKHEPSSINGGNQYEAKDRFSRENLNAITENAFYAMAKSDDAKAESSSAISIANEALAQSQKTGTQVNVGGLFQNYLDFTSDPQEQINNLKEGAIENGVQYSEIVDTTSAINPLDSKANKDLSNVTYPQVVADGVAKTGAGDRVVESYLSSDGTTWYRKWASGWKECGVYLSNSTWAQLTITLPISFSNDKYTVVTGMESNAGQTDYKMKEFGMISHTSNTITLYVGNNTSSTYYPRKNIYCCGY